MRSTCTTFIDALSRVIHVGRLKCCTGGLRSRERLLRARGGCCNRIQDRCFLVRGRCTLTRTSCAQSSVLCRHRTVVVARFRRSKDHCLRDLRSERSTHVRLARISVRVRRSRRALLSLRGRTFRRGRARTIGLEGTASRLRDRLAT